MVAGAASLPVVAGAAPTIEDWSESEGTQVREAVTQTPHTEGTAHNYTATADHLRYIKDWDLQLLLNQLKRSHAHDF